MMPKSIRNLVLAMAFWSLAANSAPAQLIALPNVSTNAVAGFDLVHAAVDDRIRITSLEPEAVIPKNLLHPIVEWEAPASENAEFLVELKSTGRTLTVCAGKSLRWQPDGNEFAGFLEEGGLQVTVYRLNRGLTLKSPPVRLVVSDRSLADRIIYRVVPLFFIPGQPVAINQMFLQQRQPDQLLRVEGTCVGCHAYTPESAVFNCIKLTDRKAISYHREEQQVHLNRHDFGQFSFVSLSPDGKQIAFVKNSIAKLVVRKDVVVPFDLVYRAGDIWIYNFETGAAAPLPGASSPEYIEDMPSFSPDGKYVVFSRYQAQGKKRKSLTVESMDLYQVPFNGGRGGEPVPIPNASANGLHQFFARYSPNGKWISFCRADGHEGIFARKDSDIYLLSRDDNRVTRLALNREDAMDSWHDWSADSHWLIFSSKRDKHQRTAIYLSYIDDSGKDHPPVKIVDDPENKINTPQFAPPSLELKKAGNLVDFIYGSYK